MRRYPVGGTLADNLQSGVLYPPGFLGILHRVHCQIEHLPIEHIRPLVDGAKHRAANAGILMSKQFQHQRLAYRATRRTPADVAAVNSEYLIGGHKADVVVLMKNIFTEQVITYLAGIVEPYQNGFARICRERFPTEILLVSIGISSGLERKKRIVRLGAPRQFGEFEKF